MNIIEENLNENPITDIYPIVLTHSNHFCELDIESEVVKLWPNTMYRNVRLERLLRQSQELDSTTIQLAMADHFSHPHSICAHYDENEAETLRLQSNHSIMISLSSVSASANKNGKDKSYSWIMDSQ